ncbi:helix-turn-helix domain-containing protein [Roseomonas sp. NAR14]|uniref:Helix-turn-helix domain-containing protein n=1 Tax=Roseomonas acroporae TaxID=2937791 RepID=A0A9X2BVE3_9PROT|nr:helix-turn-helix domain-containing protein [Roseomonas acroporae]MCK8786597.1 helix-turn-helix domain-containing protein [Roseomonas acroporae]
MPRYTRTALTDTTPTPVPPPPPAPLPAAMGMTAAARFLGCGRTTIYRLAKRGELTPRKLGKRTVFTTDDLRALLERAAVPGAVVARERVA